MTWSFLYGDVLKNKEKSSSVEQGEVPMEGSGAQSSLIEQDDAYQKKLFENDLYVWSLLLLKNNDI